VAIVVTGAAGFVGRAVLRHLVRAGEQVVAVDRRPSLAAAGVRVVTADLLDAGGDVTGALRRADAVIHLAGCPGVRDDRPDVERHRARDNVDATARVLETVPPAVPLVVASSSSVYGANPKLPKRESMLPMPMSPYAVSKLATEQYALAWQHSYGMRTLAFRFFNVFGPLQAAGHAYAAVVPAFVSAALAGEALTVHGDGQQSRDFTYVGTVCHVLIDAIQRDVTDAQPVNLAFGTRTDLLDLIGRIEALVGHSVEVNHVDPRPGDVRHSQASGDKLLQLFPDLAPVDLDTGLAETVEWMRSQLSQDS
jgi:UDP-glucose 4-epimerase